MDAKIEGKHTWIGQKLPSLFFYHLFKYQVSDVGFYLKISNHMTLNYHFNQKETIKCVM